MGDVEEIPSADFFKITASLILFSIAFVGGVLPQRLENVGSKVVSCLNTAAGGVFFASAMVHMLPESSETLTNVWGDVVPWGGFLSAFGFLLILCIDQAVQISHANRESGKLRRSDHTLIPTSDPPDAEQVQPQHQQRSEALARGRHRNSNSEDLAGLMSAISPRALLSSSGRGASAEPPVVGGRGGGGGSSSGAGGAGESQERLISSTVDGEEDDDLLHGRGNNGSRGGGGRGGGGNGRPHDSLSHGLVGEDDGICVRFALLIALSVHSVMEGLGVGAEKRKAYNLLFAIACHKGLAAYALGASLLQSGVRGKQLTLFVLAFSAMTPIGILIGAIIEEDGEDDSAGAVCVALAAGTFLYVALMEVLPPELASTEHGWSKLGSLLAGFFVSAGVAWLAG
eukprot:g16665.t2